MSGLFQAPKTFSNFPLCLLNCVVLPFLYSLSKCMLFPWNWSRFSPSFIWIPFSIRPYHTECLILGPTKQNRYIKSASIFFYESLYLYYWECLSWQFEAESMLKILLRKLMEECTWVSSLFQEIYGFYTFLVFKSELII